MPRSFRTHFIAPLLALLVLVACAASVSAQVEEGEESDDPIKLFEKGQDAHGKGDIALALEFYEEALKLKPEFPEAEFQRGNALVALGRAADAEGAFRRAAELKKDWALPHAALGLLVARAGRDAEAEPSLRRAVELDPKLTHALVALALVRARAGAKPEALKLVRQATENGDAGASVWLARAQIERDAGDLAAAAASVERVLRIDPRNSEAFAESAELHAQAGRYERAVEDMKAALRPQPDSKKLLTRLAFFYGRAGKEDEARRVLAQIGAAGANSPASSQAPDPETRRAVESLQAELAANSEDPREAVPALEKILQGDPKNASVLARLGALYRTLDARKSLDYYHRAAEIEPANPGYATGYAAALVQARRFAEAVLILRRVVTDSPEHYAAHANLAAALDESGQFEEALKEYEWLKRARPELAVIDFFIALAYDRLTEYRLALIAYERFLARADAAKNGLEIEKVNLRLPALREQIKRGQGAKRKKNDQQSRE